MDDHERDERRRQFEALCRQEGLPLTVQRRAILDIVLGRHDHRAPCAWALGSGLGGPVDIRAPSRTPNRKRSLNALCFLREGFPNPLLEAMACALPVVATAVGAVPSVVTSGEDALIVEPGDASQLADALARLLCDAALRRSMAAKARETACARFSGKGPWVTDLLDAYSSLLSSPTPSGHRDALAEDAPANGGQPEERPRSTYFRQTK